MSCQVMQFHTYRTGKFVSMCLCNVILFLIDASLAS